MKKIQESNWVPVPGFEGSYIINRQGSIRSLHPRYKGKEMPQKKDRAGYLSLRLSRRGFSTTQYVHRLLALAFLPNPGNIPFVNHLNGNKLDNRLENLQWCTHAENIKHAYDTGLIPLEGKGKAVLDIRSRKRYGSAKEAAAALGLRYTTLKNYLNGNRHNPTFLRYAEGGQPVTAPLHFPHP